MKSSLSSRDELTINDRVCITSSCPYFYQESFLSAYTSRLRLRFKPEIMKYNKNKTVASRLPVG